MTFRTVLVTGAASGIGRAAAAAFAARGWQVCATDVRDGGAVRMDITRPQEVAATLRDVLDRHGRLDAVANCAGAGLLGAFEGTAEQDLRRIVEVNLFGAATLLRAVLPVMRDQRAGVFVQVSSVAARIGYPGASAYCAAKAAQEALIEAVRIELAGTGVALRIVRPGPVDTGFDTPTARDHAPAYCDGLVDRVRAVFRRGLRGAVPAGHVAAAIVAAAEDPDAPPSQTVGRAAHMLLARRAAMSDADWYAAACRTFR